MQHLVENKARTRPSPSRSPVENKKGPSAAKRKREDDEQSVVIQPTDDTGSTGAKENLPPVASDDVQIIAPAPSAKEASALESKRPRLRADVDACAEGKGKGQGCRRAAGSSLRYVVDCWSLMSFWRKAPQAEEKARQPTPRRLCGQVDVTAWASPLKARTSRARPLQVCPHL